MNKRLNHNIKDILKNSGSVMFSNIFDIFINIVIISVLAKYFGQAEFGKLSFLSVFLFFFGSLDDFLIKPILIRELSRNRLNSSVILGNGLIIRVLLSLIVIAVFWFCAYFTYWKISFIKLVFFASLGIIMTSIGASYETAFQANLRMLLPKALNVINKIITLGLVYLVVIFKGTLLDFYMLSCILGALLLLTLKHYAEKLIKPEFKIDFMVWREIICESWPLWLTAICIFIYHRIDQILLFRMKGPDSVGFYSAAVKFSEIFNVVPMALKASILPLLAHYYKISSESFTKIYELSFKYLLLFIIPIVIIVNIFSKEIIYFIYGDKFIISASALNILIFSEIFVFMGIVNNSILIASGKQIMDPVFTGASAFINVILNLFLIPRYGFIGAAIASLVSYPVGPVMGFFFKVTKPYSLSMFRHSLKPLVGAAIMGLCAFQFKDNIFISLVIAAVVYSLVIYLIRGINKSDKAILMSIFTGSKKYDI